MYKYRAISLKLQGRKWKLRREQTREQKEQIILNNISSFIKWGNFNKIEHIDNKIYVYYDDYYLYIVERL